MSNTQKPHQTSRCQRGTWRGTWAALLVAGAFATGCGTSTETKKSFIDKAMADPGLRRDTFEATLRVLDERPEYVKELFAAVRKHPKTLDSFFDTAAIELRDPALAKLASKHIVAHPPSIEVLLPVVLDEAKDNAKAKASIARAVQTRGAATAALITEYPETLRAVIGPTLRLLEQRTTARQVFFASLRAHAPQVVSMLMQEPSVLGAMAEEFLKVDLKSQPALLKIFSKF